VSSAGRIRKVDHQHTDLTEIPLEHVKLAIERLHIVYEHTSHGSQLITGMNALRDFPEFGGVYAWNDSGVDGALDLDDYGIPATVNDLSQGDRVNDAGDTPWVEGTRALLNSVDNSHVNVVIWSWCSINGHNAQRYIENMEKLIEEFPDVIFVYMTGHAEGMGLDGTINGVHYNNELIRSHAEKHDRWLFDFADIEAFDPDGNYYWDKAMQDNLDFNGGNWAVSWVDEHSSQLFSRLTTGENAQGYYGVSGCAHSDYPDEANLNCVLKGAAAWSLFTKIAQQIADD